MLLSESEPASSPKNYVNEHAAFVDVLVRASSDGTTNRPNADLVLEPIAHQTGDDIAYNVNGAETTRIKDDDNVRKQGVLLKTDGQERFRRA